MVRLVRAHGLQVAALSVAAGFVTVLAVMTSCGGSSTTTASRTPSPAATPSATPTVDPRVAQVDAAARRWIRAYVDAYRTGSADELNTLVVPGSDADAEAGAPRHDVMTTHKTFLVSKLTFDAVTVSAFATAASAEVSYSMLGFNADWPQLTQRDSARVLRAHTSLTFQLIGAKWLLSGVH